MSKKMRYEELVELLQEGKIGYLRFVLEGENEQDYLECAVPTAQTLRMNPQSFISSRRTSAKTIGEVQSAGT